MFLNQTTYTTGASSTPNAIAAVDVNGDSKPDMILANQGSHNVGVLFNAGNGTFFNQTTYSTVASSAPNAIAVVDVNGDNKPDIVVVNGGLNNVGVLFNAGNGTFLNQTIYSTGASSSPNSVAVVDVNGDNKPDIVVTNSISNNVGVFLNAGNGTFLNQTTYSTGTGCTARSVVVVDMNNDNKSDVVFACQALNYVGVLSNVGDGTFVNQSIYSTGTGSSPRSVVVGDVNGDNKPDIVVTNGALNTVGVLLNAGNGTFLNQTSYSTGTGSSPRSVAIGDVNSDNKPDIVVTLIGLGIVGVFLNAGNSTFLNQTNYSTGAGSTSRLVVLADVNNDNYLDILVSNQGTSNAGVLLHC